jgi:protein O-GlcNAc transferase
MRSKRQMSRKSRKSCSDSRHQLAEQLIAAFENHRLGRLNRAEKIYRRVVKDEPRNAAAWHLLGIVALQRSRAELAIDLISRAVEIMPNLAQAHRNLGKALVVCDRLPEAERSFIRALTFHPYPAHIHCDLSEVLLKRGDFQGSITALYKGVAAPCKD